MREEETLELNPETIPAPAYARPGLLLQIVTVSGDRVTLRCDDDGEACELEIANRDGVALATLDHSEVADLGRLCVTLLNS